MVNPSNFQGSYTVTDNIGLIGNVFARNRNPESVTNLFPGEFISKTLMFEGGVGYYTSSVDSNSFLRNLAYNSILDEFEGDLVFETYAGGGAGNVSHNFRPENDPDHDIYKLSTNVSKFFIQPSLGVSGKNIEAAITTKLTAVGFSSTRIQYYPDDQLEYFDFDHVNRSPLYLFFEPGLTVRGGIPEIKGHMQIAYSNKLSSTPLYFKNYILNFGIHVNITETIKTITGNSGQ